MLPSGNRVVEVGRVAVRVPVYDTEMLIALTDPKAKAVYPYEGLRAAAIRTTFARISWC